MLTNFALEYMALYPSEIDDDTSLPFISDDFLENGATAINDLRDAVFAVEQELGVSLKGSLSSLTDRFYVSFEQDGYIKSEALSRLGYVTLPIYDREIAINAAIQESKLQLLHSTTSLYNSILANEILISTHSNFLNQDGYKFEPHIYGTNYNHYLDDIIIGAIILDKLDTARALSTADTFTLFVDINSELLYHQKADGIGYNASLTNVFVKTDGYSLSNTYKYPSYFAHLASGIYIIPQLFDLSSFIINAQGLIDYIDSNYILNAALNYQNLYSNGISNESRSASLLSDVGGDILIPSTDGYTYLVKDGNSSAPVDDINIGDDIIVLNPVPTLISSYRFDAWFSAVKIGDYAVVNYKMNAEGYDANDTREFYFKIKEIKYVSSKVYQIRIDNKNLYATKEVIVRIERNTFNTNKKHVLALSAVNYSSSQSLFPSLIAIQPRSASVVGKDLNLNLLNSSRYNLYLQIYPTGDPTYYYISLPAIDVTGNAGVTPGAYTLQSIIETTNNTFRAQNCNYRFAAFDADGNFGLSLTDSYNNIAFSIVNSGTNNVAGTTVETDPLGLIDYSSIAYSSAFNTAYSSLNQALSPTKIFLPSKRDNFYVNEAERERFAREEQTILDGYGDGYYIADYLSKNGTNPIKRTFVIYHNLTNAKLWQGASVVLQPNYPSTNFSDYAGIYYGRFVIESVSFTVDGYTHITLFDSCHASATDPDTLVLSKQFRIYLCNDAITCNADNMSDLTLTSAWNRYFESYINNSGNTFTVERARYSSTGNVTVNGTTLYSSSSNIRNFHLVSVSSGMQGYLYSAFRKISLRIASYSSTTGIYSGYICDYNGTSDLTPGKTTYGKAGQVTRFYDNYGYNYIDIYLDINSGLSTFSNAVIDYQLFESLETDGELFELGSFNYRYGINQISFINDKRQFGTIGEQNLSTSAKSFITAGERLLHANTVLSGFDIVTDTSLTFGEVHISNGSALVNGKIITKQDSIINVPQLSEVYGSQVYPILWAVCLNEQEELCILPLLDYDTQVANVNASDRILTVTNNDSGTTYNLIGYTFSELLSKKEYLVLFVYSVNIFVHIALAVSPTTTYPSVPVTVTATITTSDGSSLPAGSLINFYYYSFVDGTNHAISGSPVTVVGGTATITFSFPVAGLYTIHAVYAGS